MSQSVHTPGPWQPFEILDGIAIKDNRNVTIAICDYATDADAIEVSEWETEANGQVIAAAPEMFEQLSSRQKLLEKALEEITIGDPEKAETYIELALTEGAAAIAKAKGGAA